MVEHILKYLHSPYNKVESGDAPVIAEQPSKSSPGSLVKKK